MKKVIELHEKLNIAIKPSLNPYQATFGSLKGIPWQGEVYCGHNPYLKARIVTNISSDSTGKFTWEEIKTPTI